MKPETKLANNRSTGVSHQGLVFIIISAFTHVLFLGRDILLAQKVGLNISLDAWLMAYALIAFVVGGFSGSFAGVIVPWMHDEESQGRSLSLKVLLPFVLRKYKYSLAVILFVMSSAIFGSIDWLVQNFLQSLIISGVAISIFILMILNSFYRGFFLAKNKSTVTVIAPFISIIVCTSIYFISPLTNSLLWYVGSIFIGGLSETCYYKLMSRMLEPESPSTISLGSFSNRLISFRKLYLSGLLMGTTVLVDQLVAAIMFGDGISSLSFANKISMGVIGLIGGAVSAVVFPFLSKSRSEFSYRDWRKRVYRIVMIVFAIGLSIAALVHQNTYEIINILFQRGQFTHEDSLIVSSIQSFYIYQLPFYLASGVLVHSLQSLNETEIILRTALFNAVANLTWNFVLAYMYGLKGIALSTTLVYFGSFAILAVSLGLLSGKDLGNDIKDGSTRAK